MKKKNIPFTLQLFVTEKCNLKCQYCYEGIERKSTIMRSDIAQSALTRIIPRLDCDEVIIDFIGGEPLFAFDLLKNLVDFAKKHEHHWRKKYTFFATTNGTLLNNEMKEWLYDHRDTIVLGLSLDGTRAAHNLNRSNSYDLIEPHLSFFREAWPFQPVKMTITPQTVDHVYEGILNIYSYGLKCSANVVYEDVWSGIGRNKYLQVFASELERLVEYFGARPDLEVPGLILDLPIQNFIAEMEKDWNWCGADRSMKCIYIDGREFPCHRFATTFCNKSSFSDKNSCSPNNVNTKCKNCKFFYACPTCDAYNYEMNGSQNYKTDYHCDLIKLQIIATAKLKYRRLNYDMLKRRHMDQNIDKLGEIVNTIDSILYVGKHMEMEGYGLSSKSIQSSLI